MSTTTTDHRDLMRLAGPDALAQLHGGFSDTDLDLIAGFFERHGVTADLDDDTFAERIGIQDCGPDAVRMMREIYAEVAR